MKVEITDNENQPLGEVHENKQFDVDLPLEQKETIRELIQTAKRYNVDTGPVQGDPSREPITPGEKMTDHEGYPFLRRLERLINRYTPYHAEIVEMDDVAIKSVENPWEAPDGKEVREGPPGYYYYHVDKDAEVDSDGEVLEIRDHYRVWVKDEQNVPEEHTARYDEEGDPAGNHWYYEVPFETATRIDLSEEKVEPDTVIEKTQDAEMTPAEIDEFGVSDIDKEQIEKASNAISNDEPVWGDDYFISKGILTDIESPISLLSLYKMFYEKGGEYTKYLQGINAELRGRGIQAVDKISRKRRIIGQAGETRTFEKEGEYFRFDRD